MAISDEQMKKLIRTPGKVDKCSCGTKYNYIGLGEYKCPNCGNKTRDAYGRVRLYIDEHGSSSPIELMQNADVSRLDIKQLLQRGDLELVAGRIR